MIQREAWYREAGELQTFYHVTPTKNLPSIQRNGLTPAIGPRSQMLGEGELAVYLFKTKEEAGDALGSWLGDYFPEEEPMALLEVLVEPQALQGSAAAQQEMFEVQVGDVIAPENVRVLSKDF